MPHIVSLRRAALPVLLSCWLAGCAMPPQPGSETTAADAASIKTEPVGAEKPQGDATKPEPVKLAAVKTESLPPPVALAPDMTAGGSNGAKPNPAKSAAAPAVIPLDDPPPAKPGPAARPTPIEAAAATPLAAQPTSAAPVAIPAPAAAAPAPVKPAAAEPPPPPLPPPGAVLELAAAPMPPAAVLSCPPGTAGMWNGPDIIGQPVYICRSMKRSR